MENVMENEAPSSSNIKKRGIMDSDLGKLCDSPYGCNSKNSDTFDDGTYKSIITYEQLPGKCLKILCTLAINQNLAGERPKTGKIFKRFSRLSPLSRDEILQARIDFLKDNYKRQSESKCSLPSRSELMKLKRSRSQSVKLKTLSKEESGTNEILRRVSEFPILTV